MPPNGYDTLMQQTSIPLKEIIPLPLNQTSLSLLMKISSSHHRFGLWWLRYLCLCCLRDVFLPLAETLPFWWVCRCLSLRLSCRRGNSHPRFWVLVTALPLVASIYVAVILTFLPLVEIPLFVNLPLFFLLSAVQQSPLSWSAFPSFTLPSGYPFASGGDLSFLVNLPLFISLICCVERAWQQSLMSGCVSLLPQGDGEQ